MKYVKVIILIYCFTQLAFCMCRNLSHDKTVESISGASSTGKVVRKADLLNAVKGLQNVAVLDSNTLKSIFPKQMAGLDFQGLELHETDKLGTMISTTQVTYKKDDKSIHFRVMDIGAHPDYLKTLASWSVSQFDNVQPDGGYEKSIIVNGDKTFEKYDPTYKVATFSVIYNDRLVITIYGTNLSMEEVHAVIQ